MWLTSSQSHFTPGKKLAPTEEEAMLDATEAVWICYPGSRHNRGCGNMNSTKKLVPNASWSLVMWMRTNLTCHGACIFLCRKNIFWELSCRLHLKCDGTCAESRFHLSAKRTSPFKSAGASVQSTTGSRGMRISGSNAGYTMLQGSVKSTGYPLHLPVSPSLHLKTMEYEYKKQATCCSLYICKDCSELYC
jgi:hypothetical protein